MANSFIESSLIFTFPNACQVIKFDDSRFYRNFFTRLPGGKGVDFIEETSDSIVLIEVKNCTGHEQENRHRTRTEKISPDNDVKGRFVTEIPAKVAMSVACLMGAHTKHLNTPGAHELEPYFQALAAEKRGIPQKKIVVVLVLEGNFMSRTRSKAMIMQSIQAAIREKLKWLNCSKVYVVDINTYKERYFKMETVS